MGRLAVILVLLLVNSASADIHPLKANLRDCGPRSCQVGTAYGSAVSVGGYQPGEQLFLTCAHCVQNATSVSVGVSQQWRQVRVLATSQQSDLAILSLSYSGTINTSRIAPTDATGGEAVTLTGFPNGGGFRKRTAKVVPNRYSRIDLVIGQPSQQGESGGGIFNARGELVGLISLTSEISTLGPGVRSIRAIFQSHFGKLPPCCVGGGSIAQPTIPPTDNSEVLARLQQLENKIDSIQLQRGPAGPPGRDGESWNREVVRGWVSEEVREQVQQAISDVPVIAGPRGPQGQRGEMGPQGPPGQSYDPSEINELRQRVTELENRPSTVVVKPEPEARKITIYVQEIGPDGKPTGRTVATPVEVPPNENEITIPITRKLGS